MKNKGADQPLRKKQVFSWHGSYPECADFQAHVYLCWQKKKDFLIIGFEGKWCTTETELTLSHPLKIRKGPIKAFRIGRKLLTFWLFFSHYIILWNLFRKKDLTICLKTNSSRVSARWFKYHLLNADTYYMYIYIQKCYIKTSDIWTEQFWEEISFIQSGDIVSFALNKSLECGNLITFQAFSNSVDVGFVASSHFVFSISIPMLPHYPPT